MKMETAERASFSEAWSVTHDTIIAVSGTMYFAKSSERGRRDFTYTPANGTTQDGQFTIDSDVQNDNPTVSFDTSPTLFPFPHRVSDKFTVVSFEDSQLEFFYELEAGAGRTRYQYTMVLTR